MKIFMQQYIAGCSLIGLVCSIEPVRDLTRKIGCEERLIRSCFYQNSRFRNKLFRPQGLKSREELFFLYQSDFTRKYNLSN